MKAYRIAKIGFKWSHWTGLSVLMAAGLCGVQGASIKGVHPLDANIVGEEIAPLSSGPSVPPPITRTHSTKVIVDLEAKEVTQSLAQGVEYPYWTFGGEVPGNFIRVRQGDLVELHLSNHPENQHPHNIDLHAVTGPGGGAASSFTVPGRESQFSFRALNPGLYVYHCAAAPIGMHVAHGMYGMILVEPKEGLPPVDREYYLMQGEFYTTGKFGEPGLQAFDEQKALDERPDYVVFNGAVDSLTGQRALKARVGETVRLYIGNAGPNLTASFRVVGEIFDRVYPEGGSLAQENVQATVIPAGGSAIVEFKVEVPGKYHLIDNSLFRAFNKGALAMLEVSGSEDLLVYSGKQAEGDYSSDRRELLAAKSAASQGTGGAVDTQVLSAGEQVYKKTCFVCHQANGQGLPGMFPPLAKSDYLMEDKNRSIQIVLEGLSGPVEVNGSQFNGIMPPVVLNDEQIASVLTYVRNSWGNTGEPVSPEEVRAIRNQGTH